MHWKQEQKAYRLHEEEAKRHGADIHNFGWGVNSEGSWISIASKTNKGILVTNVDFDTEEESHEWRQRK